MLFNVYFIFSDEEIGPKRNGAFLAVMPSISAPVLENGPCTSTGNQSCNNFFTIEPKDGTLKVGAPVLFELGTSIVDEIQPIKETSFDGKFDRDYSSESPELTPLKPLDINSTVCDQSDDRPNSDDFQLVDDIFYDSDRDPEYFPESDPTSSDNESVQVNRDNIQREDQVNEENRPDETAKKLTRKRVRNEKTWERNVKKIKINKGLAYVSRLGKDHGPKAVGPPCSDKCLLKCPAKISEADRKLVFDKYYNLEDITRKRDYLSKLILSSDAKPARSSTARKCNSGFYIEKEGKKERVCKVFLKTLLPFLTTQ